jgi:arabinose-5-phosphate isomerase
VTAGDIMSSNPKVINKDFLAAAALDIMEQYNITQIIIADDKHYPIGMIHIHDLVKSGIGENNTNDNES